MNPAAACTASGRTASAPATQEVAGAAQRLFWPAVTIVAALWFADVPLDTSAVLTAALVLLLLGGLPHGGYDAALFMRLQGSGHRAFALFITIYLALGAAMLILWQAAPVGALALFLFLSASHFADDWAELSDGLLRACAGAAVIAAPAIGQPDGVAALFIALGGPDAIWLARTAAAAAPVILLVALVGIGLAWQEGQRERAAALIAMLVVLLIVPPLLGFAIFFALLHAPRHMRMAALLIDLRVPTIAMSGWGLAGLSVMLWWLLQPLLAVPDAAITGAWAFQLLSVLVVPHFLCSAWAERHLCRN